MAQNVYVGALKLYGAKASTVTTALDTFDLMKEAIKPATGTPTHLYLGDTDGGTKFSYDPQIKKFYRDQKLTSVAQRTTGIESMLETQLGDFIARNFQLTLGGGKVTDTAGKKVYTPPPGFETELLSLIGETPTGELIWWPECAPEGGLSLSMTKDDDSTVPFKLGIQHKEGLLPFYFAGDTTSKVFADDLLL